MRMRLLGLTCWSCLVVGFAPLTGCASVLKGVVPEDWPTGAPAPVAVPLRVGMPVYPGYWIELQIEGRLKPIRVVAQYEYSGSSSCAWFMWQADPKDFGKRVTVRFIPRIEPFESVYISQDDDPFLHLITRDGKPILSYHHGQPEPGKPYPLSDYMHPIIGLDGEMLTDLWPADHLHQRGVFWAWVRHQLNGKSLGSWWGPIDGSVLVEPGKIDVMDGPVFTRFAASHYLVHHSEKGDPGERFIDEQVVCRVYPTVSTGRAIDVELTLRPLKDGIFIGGTTTLGKGYGGFTFRYNQASDKVVVIDGVLTEKDSVNKLNAKWVDWSGRFKMGQDPARPKKSLYAKTRSGAALFAHPSHPAFPPKWITRKYGIVGTCYPGVEMLELEKDKPLRLRHRIWIHRGGAAEGKVDENYRAYAADWKWAWQ